MLKVRVLSAVVGLALLFFVAVMGKGVLSAAVFIFAVVGVNEFYNALLNAGYKPVKMLGFISCLPIFLMGFFNAFKQKKPELNDIRYMSYLALSIFLLILVLFAIKIISNEKYNLVDISMTAFGIIYVAFLFLFIVLTRNLTDGGYFIWLIFIGAWSTDTFAYFAGRLFGKTKLLPHISPKKTLEGAIGGIAGCILMNLLYGLYLVKSGHLTLNMPLYHFIIIGLLNGIISQLGDWAASAVKRFASIKDFGNIMPGHGGVLDRFDSILFAAPVVYFYITFLVL